MEHRGHHLCYAIIQLGYFLCRISRTTHACIWVRIQVNRRRYFDLYDLSKSTNIMVTQEIKTGGHCLARQLVQIVKF